MKRKYGSEPWFQGKSHFECISVKDALKISLVKPLETILVSEFIVALVGCDYGGDCVFKP